jgi:hypothetical protein
MLRHVLPRLIEIIAAWQPPKSGPEGFSIPKEVRQRIDDLRPLQAFLSPSPDVV